MQAVIRHMTASSAVCIVRCVISTRRQALHRHNILNKVGNHTITRTRKSLQWRTDNAYDVVPIIDGKRCYVGTGATLKEALALYWAAYELLKQGKNL